MRPAILLFAFVLFDTSCSTPKEKTSEILVEYEFHKDPGIKYAQRFATGFTIDKGKNYRTIYLYGDRHSEKATAVFILYSKGDKKPELNKEAFYISTPVDKVACMGTVYTTMMQKLGLLNKIVAVENTDYYNNEFIVDGVKEGRIKELSKGPEINVEQTILLKPDLIITFGMGNPKKDMSQKVLSAGIPVAITLDHLEESPLARAEWLKFVSYFFNKEQMADSLFDITEKNYAELKKMTDTIQHKPSVFTDIKYGDAWYVPGGNSYMANMIKDAGGDYRWKEENKTGSIPLNFESVYAKAKDCDYWINLFMIKSKKELLGYETRYNLFKAFKTGNIYNNNKVANANGYSTYWEEGMCAPDEILKDLIGIFHPSLLKNHALRYYKKIE